MTSVQHRVVIEDIDPIVSKGSTVDGQAIIKRHTLRVWPRYWLHFLAIAATGGAAALNLMDVFLMDADDSNAIAKLGAFQFVAKLHEAIMLGSLSVAMIDMIRKRLLTSGGVPLGYMLSPVMYNNIDWLLSASFWINTPKTKRLFSDPRTKRSSVTLFLFVILAIVFANVAGPISAIAIVPRLGWSDSEPATAFPQFWNMSAVNIWPTEFSAAALPARCFTGGAAGGRGCPSRGSKLAGGILSYQFGAGAQCTSHALQSSCNASASASGAANPITRMLSIDFDLDAPVAYVSTPTSQIYETLASRFQNGMAFPFDIPKTRNIEADKTQLVVMHLLGSEQLSKPAVKTVCKDLKYAEIVQLYQDKSISNNWSTPTATWLTDASGPERDSFLLSYQPSSTAFDSPTDCRGEECYAAVVCSIDARWSRHSLWYSTAQPTFLFQDHPQPRDIFQAPATASQRITIRKDWLELTTVNGSTDRTLPEVIVSLINEWRTPQTRAPQPIPGTLQEDIGPTNHSVAISIILASVIAEGLAQGPGPIGDSLYNGDCNNTKPGFSFSPDICAEDPSFWATTKSLLESVSQDYSMVSFSVRRAGWGWFWGDSLALQLSLGTLLLHALLTTVYLLYTLIFTRTLTTRWASATELLILAIDSFRAPALAGSSIKPRDSKIWLEPVTIREVEYGDRVSLIVGDGAAYPERVGGLPELGKKYL